MHNVYIPSLRDKIKLDSCSSQVSSYMYMVEFFIKK